MDDTILSRLQPIFCDVLDDDEIRVSANDSARSVDGWDSLAHIRLIMTIESQFNIKFTLSELEDMKNIGEMISLMRAKGVSG
jgi:acyl carrier protein